MSIIKLCILQHREMFLETRMLLHNDFFVWYPCMVSTSRLDFAQCTYKVHMNPFFFFSFFLILFFLTLDWTLMFTLGNWCNYVFAWHPTHLEGLLEWLTRIKELRTFHLLMPHSYDWIVPCIDVQIGDFLGVQAGGAIMWAVSNER